MDFMSDALSCGRRFRTFNVIDDYNRECLLIEPSYSLPSICVVALLEQLAGEQGYPEMIRMDNGPEFVAGLLKDWARDNHVLIHYIQPGNPAQNGYIERFNRSFREEVLDMNIFDTLQEVLQFACQWIREYNDERHHESLAGLSPTRFKQEEINIHREKT